jgi:hypothetical protein
MHLTPGDGDGSHPEWRLPNPNWGNPDDPAGNGGNPGPNGGGGPPDDDDFIILDPAGQPARNQY